MFPECLFLEYFSISHLVYKMEVMFHIFPQRLLIMARNPYIKCLVCCVLLQSNGTSTHPVTRASLLHVFFLAPPPPPLPPLLRPPPLFPPPSSPLPSSLTSSSILSFSSYSSSFILLLLLFYFLFHFFSLQKDWA